MAGGRVIPKQLRFHLRQLSRWGFKPVSLGQALRPCAGRCFAVSFDDAFQDVFYNALPILQEFGVKAGVFVVSDFVGKKPGWDVSWGTPGLHMTRDQLLQLRAVGWEIGSHTLSHPDLTAVSDQSLQRELVDSKAALEDLLSEEIRFFSYPFGRFNKKVRDAVEAAGYQAAFTMRRGADLRWTDPMLIPRMSVYLPDYSLYRKMEPMYAGLDAAIERFINMNAKGTSWVRHKLPWLGRLLGMSRELPG